MPYNKDINGGDPMNNTELQELRQDILEEIEDMDIELLKRIAYECRCEENGIYPDQTYIRWWFRKTHIQTSAFPAMLKTNVLKVIGETSKGITLTRSQKFEVFCNVCDNLLAEGRITQSQHNRWTNVF